MKTDHNVDRWTQRFSLSLAFVGLWTETWKNWKLPRRLGWTTACRRLLFVTGGEAESRQKVAWRWRRTGSLTSTWSRTFWWRNGLHTSRF